MIPNTSSTAQLQVIAPLRMKPGGGRADCSQITPSSIPMHDLWQLEGVMQRGLPTP